MNPIPRGRDLFWSALRVGRAAYQLGQEVSFAVEAAGYTKSVATQVYNFIMSANKKNSGNTRRRRYTEAPPGQALSQSRNVPKANIGRDHLLGLPTYITRDLSQSYQVVFSAAAGAYTATTMILNSGYKPDGSLSMRGFATYMGFYTKAYTLGCRYIIKGVLSTPGTTRPSIVGCAVSTNTATLTSAENAIASGMSDWAVVWKNPDRFTFTGGVDSAKFFTKAKVIDDPNLYATTSAVPPQLIVLHVFLEGSNSETSTITYTIQLIETIMFVDPLPLIGI